MMPVATLEPAFVATKSAPCSWEVRVWGTQAAALSTLARSPLKW